MTNFDDLIQYEVENSNLDFKGIQYHKDIFDSFIKDIMSMANADSENEKHIIIGVTWDDHGDRQLLGIKKEDFVDPSTYQQIIRENIEPDIHLSYFLHEFDNKYFPIFTVSNCSDKPYMMKKAYKNLAKGETWIRKGTHQDKMIRRDLENIFKKKFETKGFDGDVSLLFSESRTDCLEITVIDDIILPSENKKRSIEKAIAKKKNPPPSPPKENYNSNFLFDFGSAENIAKIVKNIKDPFHLSYDDLPIEDLGKKLESVNEDYQEDDLYTLFERDAKLVNLEIFNTGEEYIEDASIELTFPKNDGLIIASKIYEKPVHYPAIANSFHPPFHYPHVEENEKGTTVYWNIGSIKHNKRTKIFIDPLRIKARKSLVGKTFPIHCKLFGKNIPKPILIELKLHFVQKAHPEQESPHQ